MNVTIILVRPSVPENIGAVARAMKNMGLKNLRIIEPLCELSGKAEWVAHASRDILEQATFYNSLPEALADIDYAIATSAKKRKVRFDYLSPEMAVESALSKQNTISHLAFIFGNESHGLKDKEIELCHIVSTIPMEVSYPSLNLSHAVMIYAYEWFKHTKPFIKTVRNTNAAEFRKMNEEVKKILADLQVNNNPNLYNRIFERLALTRDEDIHLILSLCERYFRKYQK